jgi:hypothetical protein
VHYSTHIDNNDHHNNDNDDNNDNKASSTSKTAGKTAYNKTALLVDRIIRVNHFTSLTKNGDADNQTQNIHIDKPSTDTSVNTTTTTQQVPSPKSTTPPAKEDWHSYRSLVASISKKIDSRNEELIIDVLALSLVITLLCTLISCFILCFAYVKSKRALAEFLELAFALQIKFPAVRHWVNQGDSKTFRACKRITDYTNMRRINGAQITHQNQLDDNEFYSLTNRSTTPPPPPPPSPNTSL